MGKSNQNQRHANKCATSVEKAVHDAARLDRLWKREDSIREADLKAENTRKYQKSVEKRKATILQKKLQLAVDAVVIDHRKAMDVAKTTAGISYSQLRRYLF